MSKNKMAGGLKAKHGEKMIEVRIRLWTNHIAKSGRVIPKHAWDHGVVHIEANSAHGIAPSNPIPFNSLLGVGVAIEKVLIGHGIKLHRGNKMGKYVV